MSVLLDTHAFLWYITDDAQLSRFAEQTISDSGNDVYLSIVSVWEIAIKHSLKKLNLPSPFAEFIPEQLLLNAMKVLPIEIAHLSAYVGLPYHHRDPFDRMMVAQAQIEDMPLVSNDALISSYEIDVIW